MGAHEPLTRTMPFTEIMAKIDRAAVNGQKLHLDVEHVRALAASPVYTSIADMKAQEFAELWHEPKPNSPSASSLAPSGLSPEPSVESGSLPGTMKPLVHAAAERQASRTVEKINLLSRRKKRSPTISPITASPPTR